MSEKQNLFRILRWKLVTLVLAAPGVWVISGILGFPTVFRKMFVFYIFLGVTVFVILDFPMPKEVTGRKAGAAVLGFFVTVAVFFAIFGSLWPQFSVKHETAGIERKTRKYEQEAKEAKPLSQKATELSEKADVILAKLAELEAAGVQVAGLSRDLEKAMGSLGESPGAPAGRASVGFDGGDIVVRGKLVYEDYECYNCHKIGGTGGKKRGPKLDNIGNLVTPVQLKDKIFNPEAWYAEGFEKRTKDKMPDTYRDLMSDKELEALVSYLMTLKDPTVDTPKPVFPSKS